MLEAQQFAEAIRRAGRFTDLSGFSLRCQDCQCPLKGQQAARQHAIDTGHTRFGEVHQ
ncbi:unnamed protein product [Protopolystoma xenopodis]|uniref:OTU1-like C-terminal C2H2-type zinc finger domain-containing protein n=1 Tax=Protopolystoma xenopodis TaxID=117903 RepID=A0A448WY09_9PLAT|nr:unnamed protein product [Protopolystoma xenopodis]